MADHVTLRLLNDVTLTDFAIIRGAAKAERGAITPRRRGDTAIEITFNRYGWAESARAAHRFRSALPARLAALEIKP